MMLASPLFFPSPLFQRALFIVNLRTGFMDMLRDHVPSPVDNARNKVAHAYTGDLGSAVAQDMLNCDPQGELMVHITKLYPSQDASTFDAFGRVMSGTIEKNERVRVRAMLGCGCRTFPFPNEN